MRKPNFFSLQTMIYIFPVIALIDMFLLIILGRLNVAD